MRILFYNKMYQSFLWTILMFYTMYCFLIWPCDILALQPLNFVNQLLSHNSKGFQSELVCCLCLVTKSKQDQEVCQTMTLPPDYWLCMINRQMWTLGVIKAEQQIPGKDICWINSHQNLPFFTNWMQTPLILSKLHPQVTAQQWKRLWIMKLFCLCFYLLAQNKDFSSHLLGSTHWLDWIAYAK